ncbi:MAG: T9SS type A sorting domain-containing protein, partial [Bacteroidota bacterium]
GTSTINRTKSGRFTISGYGMTNLSWSHPSGFSPLTGLNTNSIVLEATGTGQGYVTASYRSCGVTRSASKYVQIVSSGGGGAARASLGDELEVGLSAIYPNPAVNEVTVTSTSDLKQVSVVNLMGQTLQTLSEVSGREATLNVSGLKSGSYLIIAVDAEGKQVHRLVVE